MSGNEARLLDYESCRRLDETTIARGFSEVQLMGQAALASLYRLEASRSLDEGRFLILCGSGNNGGDGLALAYMLLSRNPGLRTGSNRPRVFRTGESRTKTAAFYADLLQRLGLPLEGPEDFLALELSPNDRIIEALLGVGQRGAPRGNLLPLLEKISGARSGKHGPELVCLDVPVGLNEHEAREFSPPGGALPGPEQTLPAPDAIHTYGTRKLALELNASLQAFSRIDVLPMGFYPDNSAPGAVAFSEPAPGDLADFFMKDPLGHKYSQGHGFLLGGSRGSEGALLLAARAFFAAGGGILHALAPDEASRGILCSSFATAMYLPRTPEITGAVFPGALALGPGLSPEDYRDLAPDLIAWVKRLPERYAQAGKPNPLLILDAGALPLVREPDFPDEFRARVLLTPHSGEWARLGGPRPSHPEALREAARWNEENLGSYVLIKDAVNCLLPPRNSSEPVRIFARPNASLAQAGSGDALTGFLLSAAARVRRDGISIPLMVGRALELHSRATRDEIHPVADEFPDLARRVLVRDASRGEEEHEVLL